MIFADRTQIANLMFNDASSNKINTLFLKYLDAKLCLKPQLIDDIYQPLFIGLITTLSFFDLRLFLRIIPYLTHDFIIFVKQN